MNKFEKIMPIFFSLSTSFFKHIFVAAAYITVKYFFFFFSSNYMYTANEKFFWKSAILIVTYLSTSFAFSLYNKNQCLCFLSKQTKDIFSEILSIHFFADLAVSAIFFLIFSIHLVSPIAILASLISNLVTFVFARKVWLKDLNNKNPAHLYTVKLLVHLLLSLPGLFLLFFFASAFIPSIPTLLMVGKLLSYLLIIPIILTVFLYIRALLQMKKFLKRMNKFCKKNKIKKPTIKNPYLSVFTARPNNIFEIEIHGNIYSCNIISFTNIFRPVIFKTDGYFYRISAKNLKQKIRPSLVFETNYGYKSERSKLVLITSAPYVVKIQEGTQSKTFDTGDICGEYKIFTPDGFFGAAERNTIGRKSYD